MNLVRKLAERWDRLVFELHGRRRHETGVKETIDGVDVVVLPGVLNPRLFRTGPVLARCVVDALPKDATVLDMGAGSGVVSLLAAAAGATSVAVDVNPSAIHATRLGAQLNRLEVDVRQGDLFEPVSADERFDIIAFNPPFFGGTPPTDLSDGIRTALYDEPDLPIFDRFLAEAKAYLTAGGVVLIAGSTRGALDHMRAAYRAHGYEHAVEAAHERLAEKLVVDRLTLPR